jgi:hypothetical protein
MAETTPTVPAPVPPALPSNGSVDGKILYTLYFRHGRNPYPQFTFFYHSSKDPKVAMQRAQRHCEVQGFKFVSVQPAIVDMDKQDNFMLNNG